MKKTADELIITYCPALNTGSFIFREKRRNDSRDDLSGATALYITTMSSTRRGLPIFSQHGSFEKIFHSSHEEALNKTNVDDFGSEVSALYNCAFEFKNVKSSKEQLELIDIVPILEGQRLNFVEV